MRAPPPMVILAACPTMTAASAGRRPISWTASAAPSGRLKRSGFQLYGRRKAKPLRPRQQLLMASLLPRLRIGIESRGKFDPFSLFPRSVSEIWLEIGFAGGEHLASHAARYPQIGFIGPEPFVNGLANRHIAIEDQSLANIRIFDGDGRLLLANLQDASIARL